jgi:hypothetical protein
VSELLPYNHSCALLFTAHSTDSLGNERGSEGAREGGRGTANNDERVSE